MSITSINHKGLSELFKSGKSRRIRPDWKVTCLNIFAVLDAAVRPADCRNFFGFHALKGDRKGQFAMTVSRNWRITFTFDGPDVEIIDLEDYR